MVNIGNQKNQSLLVGLVVLHVLAGFLVGHFFHPGSWVEQLAKPSFYPPPLTFPVVWTILYALMGVSVWLFLCSEKPGKKLALFLYASQLAVNLLFTPLMFGLRNTFLGFIDVLILLPLVVATNILFYNFSPRAALLQIPYIVWLSFALILSFSLWRLTP